MQTPAIPADEAERLEALHNLHLLDTHPDERFDRLTRLAQRIFNVPTALITLIDSDRQWFKSAQGLAASQTPRNISFCAHAILHDTAMVVPDTMEDPRFADNPLVIEAPYVRFYAGMPLRAPTGHKVGTLCLVDQRPRVFTAQDVKALADLAQVVNSELDNRGLTEAMRLSRENESRLQLITDSLPVLIGYIDKEQTFQFLNRAYEELLGLDFSQIKGQALADVLSGRTFALAQNQIKKALSGQNVCYEREHLTTSGERKYFSMQYFPRYGEGAKSQQVIGIFSLGTDITEIKRIDQMKNEFVSTVSHELRTPLTSIQGSLGLIAGGIAGELPDALKSLVDIAKSNCERLVRLINAMLDSEKIASGQICLDIQKHDMHALVAQALAEINGYSEQYGVQLVLDNSSQTTPAWVLADKDRTAQVLANLLSNAIKFSSHGGEVSIAVQTVQESAGAAVRVEVHDNGPGIDTEFKSRIFQKFSQADSSDTRQKGGTGLGLNISRALVEKMNGHLGFDSYPGQGSTFYFQLPAEPAEPSSLEINPDKT